MKIIFLNTAWEDYLYWQKNDKAILKKINSLIIEIKHQPIEETGKLEPLKYDFYGWWSRRLNLEHRLVYKVENEAIILLQCRYQY